MKNELSFRDVLDKDGIVTLPGVYDCVSAMIAQSCGFDAVFTTGFGISASGYGMPDYGMITGSEMVDAVSRIKKIG